MSQKRIASLLASSTEILCALGLRDRVVAISHECDYPPEVQSRPRISRTRIDETASSGAIDEQVRNLSGQGQALYELDLERLIELKPDLIVTQEQCEVCAVSYEDVCSAVQSTPELKQCRIVALNPITLASLLEDIRRVGEAAGCPERANSLIVDLQERIDTVHERTNRLSNRPRVVCIEWVDPLMIAANWMPDLVHIAGGYYALADAGAPTRYTNWDRVIEFDPEIIIVAPCGFDLRRALEECTILARSTQWSELSAVSGGCVFAADGKAYFNRSGPRLVDSLEMLAEMIHPERFDGKARSRKSAWARYVHSV